LGPYVQRNGFFLFYFGRVASPNPLADSGRYLSPTLAVCTPVTSTLPWTKLAGFLKQRVPGLGKFPLFPFSPRTPIGRLHPALLLPLVPSPSCPLSCLAPAPEDGITQVLRVFPFLVRPEEVYPLLCNGLLLWLLVFGFLPSCVL